MYGQPGIPMRPVVGAPMMGQPMMGQPMVGPHGGYRVDVNGDGIADYRVKPGRPIDLNGDGIADARTAPRVQPAHGMGMGAPMMGGPHIVGGPMMGARPYGY